MIGEPAAGEPVRILELDGDNAKLDSFDKAMRAIDIAPPFCDGIEI
jgi:hypothetical protein